MKFKCLSVLIFTCFANFASAMIEAGSPALNFTLQDKAGKDISLGNYFGKIIVLEWRDPNCSYVQKHYSTENMQNLQKKYTLNSDIVWLTIQVGKSKDELKAYATDVLLDPAREVTKMYGITKIPEIVIINKAGYVVYRGAVDSIRSNLTEDVGRVKANYIANTLDAILSSYPVSVSHTRPYGCDVAKLGPAPFERVA